jgi:dipeptidyl aminopeptidase/acylaminoacyl peptidase
MQIPIIPRKALFGNPDRAFTRISPDGEQISWLAPREGVLNIWIAPREDLDAARPVTSDTGRGIRFYGWAFTNRHILYIQDKDGDENWRLYSVDLDDLSVRDLTPIEGVQAQIKAASPNFPNQVLVGINDRDPQLHDLYKIDISSGERTLLVENQGFMDYLIDEDRFNTLAVTRMRPDGGIDILKREEDDFVEWESIQPEDTLTTQPAGVDKTGTNLYLMDSRGRDTSALYVVDLNTGERTLLAEDPQSDASEIIAHPTEKNIQAVAFTYERKRWQILDNAIEPDLQTLRNALEGEVEVMSRTLDDRWWIVFEHVDNSPGRYYLYQRETGNLKFLFTNRTALEGLPLTQMQSAVIRTRDHLNMVVYYSLPVGADSTDDGIPDHPLPMVFFPHGGPWGRDTWGFNPFHQLLANRGYAVLSANFRSSTGFGKAFVNAGDRQWAGKIMEDQVDAVQWAIDTGIAQENKVAIMGGSFGGYSTLAGLTFYPDLFACGVDIVGPSNLITLLESIPPYWQPMVELFTTRVGDFRTDEGRELLRQHSPLTYAERIKKPLLIAQGANDPRVKQAESDQIVHAMQEKGIPVTYVLYPDEGHGFARPENSISFTAVAEAFLAEHLGGRYEPVGDDFNGASLKVLIGIEGVPGLAEALPGNRADDD